MVVLASTGVARRVTDRDWCRIPPDWFPISAREQEFGFPKIGIPVAESFGVVMARTFADRIASSLAFATFGGVVEVVAMIAVTVDR